METELELKGITKPDYYNWINQKETQLYFSTVQELIKEKYLLLGQGAALSGDSHTTVQLYARLCGQIEALTAVISVEIETDDTQAESTEKEEI